LLLSLIGVSGVALRPLVTPTATAAPTARVLLKGKDGTYTASVFVATTPKRAWAVLTNYEGLAGQLPDLKASRLLKRQGSKLELEHTYQAPYTFGRRIQATLAMTETPIRQLSYTLIRGDQIRRLQGSWTITPVQGGVQLRHQIQVDPEVPGVVRPYYNDLFETNLKQSMQILKKLMEQPG
jgi:hypothetical protein